MSTPTRIVAFVAGLGILFAVAFGLGRLFDDNSDDATMPETYSLDLQAVNASAAKPVPVRFEVLDADRRAVTGFAIRHEKPLHLIAVRKDFGSYRHLHPTMAPSGEWSIEADLGAGDWRLYADFQVEGGEPSVATADLAVAGKPTPVTPAEVTRVATIDGYTVEVIGDLVAGSAAELRFRVSKNGVPVSDLQPYLGAFGHLVVLRESDLDYLHAHPGEGPAGPEIPFHVEARTAGRYHLFLDFKHSDVVRTAPFVLDAAAPMEPMDMESTDQGGGHGGH